MPDPSPVEKNPAIALSDLLSGSPDALHSLNREKLTALLRAMQPDQVADVMIALLKQPAEINTPANDNSQAPSESRLAAMIDALAPSSEMHTGKRLLREILKARGVEGVLEYVKKTVKILDEEDGLKLHHFDPQELQFFKKIRLNLMTRRNFLETAGWGGPAIYALSQGTFKALGKGYDFIQWLEGKSPPAQEHAVEDSKNPFDRLSERTEHHLGVLEYLLIGAALLNEAAEKWLEIKLEQVARAVDELDDELKHQQAASKPLRQ
ncbi:MAG: hypothetical protein KGJ06_04660 [Pseudomonadota bacterium]|nr:hypothetical protein [Pseudomonadota bacterium]